MQVVEGLPTPLCTLLRHALQKAEAFSIVTDDHHTPARPTAPEPEPANRTLGQQPQSTKPSPREDFVHSNAVATDAQMQAWKRWVAQHVELLPCPGGSNSCALYAMLSQVLGIPRDDTITWARDIVGEYRALLAVQLGKRVMCDDALRAALAGEDGLDPDQASSNSSTANQ